MMNPGDFVGRWSLSRQIEDALCTSVAEFAGVAVLTPLGAAEMTYCETGQLSLPDAPAMQAERRYRWVFAGAKVEVAFDDGRPFHRFSLKDGAEAEHLCGADLYTVRYAFDRWPDWSSRWRVKGPRKDYVMTSHYRREGADR